jgi:hypothetical protein
MGQPAENPSPPKHRRRRWLIVALLLVLSGVSWWNWPRGDARFVGKWHVQESGSRSAATFTMTLRANGSSIWSFPLRPGEAAYTVWRVENERLVFGLNAASRFDLAIMKTQATFNALPFGLKIGLNENPFDVLSISDDQIELASSATRGKKQEFTLMLRRISE